MANDRDRLAQLVEGEHAFPGRGSGEPAHLLDASLLADQLLDALRRVERLEGELRTLTATVNAMGAP